VSESPQPPQWRLHAQFFTLFSAANSKDDDTVAGPIVLGVLTQAGNEGAKDSAGFKAAVRGSQDYAHPGTLGALLGADRFGVLSAKKSGAIQGSESRQCDE
jgi:hypothetical protein